MFSLFSSDVGGILIILGMVEICSISGIVEGI